MTANGFNGFQHGIDRLRERISKLKGCDLIMDKHDGFVAPPGNADWGGDQRVKGTIIDVCYDGHFICTAKFGDEDPAPLTAASFLLATTEWCWEADYPRDDDEPVPTSTKHLRSMERARYLMRRLIQKVDRQELKEAIVLGLDGNGENRRAYEEALDEAGVPREERPLVVTIELNPVVCLNQALRFGRERVRFSRADWRVRHQTKALEGIERCIIGGSDALLSTEEKRRVALLYMDYCGSPERTLNDDLYASLRRLAICAITIARRQPNKTRTCMMRMQAAAPTAMQLVKSYTHARVVCHVFEAGTTTMKKTTIGKRHNASDLLGKRVMIPASKWSASASKKWKDAMMVVDGKFCFTVCGTYYKHRCALRAIRKDGSLFGEKEPFTLTPEEVESMAG